MPLRKFRYLPDSTPDPRGLPRLAASDDAFVASPVHRMQQNLWAFADDPPQPEVQLYPGWLRLAFPLIASGALWVMIFWALGYLR
jgi:hypothetical protein